MEIAVIDENHDIVFASTSEMRLLFVYVCDPYKEVDWEEVDGFMHIYDLYDDSIPSVKIKKDKLTKISEQWKKISKQTSKRICARKEGESFVFKELNCGLCKRDWGKIKEIGLEDLDFEESNIFNEPGEVFNGGFHYILETVLEKRNYSLTNKCLGKHCVFTGDIKFAKDFTVNHSFFPKCWTSNEVKNQIVKALDSSKCKYVEVKDKIFSIYGYAKKGITIQVLVSDKNEILTAYPIFRERK